MKKSVMTLLKMMCLLIAVCGVNSCRTTEAKRSDIPEVENDSFVNRPAPAECIAVFRAFFQYVQKPEPNILNDHPAQTRFLSKGLRNALADHINRSGNPKENPGYPSNSSFVGVWCYPTTFSIIGSRHYDYRNGKNPDANRAIIDVLYEWDDNGGLDNQYPGSKSLRSLIFVHEEGTWKLDDIYTFADKYAGSGSSLRGYWESQS